MRIGDPLEMVEQEWGQRAKFCTFKFWRNLEFLKKILQHLHLYLHLKLLLDERLAPHGGAVERGGDGGRGRDEPAGRRRQAGIAADESGQLVLTAGLQQSHVTLRNGHAEGGDRAVEAVHGADDVIGGRRRHVPAEAGQGGITSQEVVQINKQSVGVHLVGKLTQK